MTKSLRCRDVERLMLEGEDRALPAGERCLVEEHLHACARCRGFAADRALVRAELAGVRWPAPPEELVLRTRRFVRDAEREAAPAAAPAWVLAALTAVTIITSIWLAVWLPDITPEITLADLPFAARAAVFIIVQNALMLFCAPIVLRTVRARRNELESAR
jgi:predicted anti-sigma-YlaC factor YlaD